MTSLLTTAIFIFILGTIIGSFLGVCGFRMPMGIYEPTREGVPELGEDISISSPKRSFCPACRATLSWQEVVPIVSWILQRGRCKSCKAHISSRYPLVELLTGILAVLCYLRFGISLTGVTAFLVICSLVVITLIDLDYMIIPDKITYPGTALGLLLGGLSDVTPESSVGFPLEHPFVSSFTDSIYGIIFGAGLLYAIWWLYLVVRKREGMGLGDIKLLAMLGALFGYQCSLAVIFVGSIFGSFISIALMLIKRRSMDVYIPFGPYLAFAAILYILNVGSLIGYLMDPTTATHWRMLQ